MKFSLSTYSLHELLDSGEKNLIDVIAITKDLGYDGIEFVDFTTPEDKTPLEYAKILKAECDKAGLEIVSYTISADFLHGSGGDMAAEIERLKGEVDIAEALGAKLMRHDITRDVKGTKYRTFENALPTLIEGIRAVTDYAKTKGIKTMSENHGFFCQESGRLERILTEVDRDNYGILLDIGNFICADESSVMAVGRLGDYAFHVHAKDFDIKSGNAPFFADGYFKSRGGNYLKGTIIGHGDVPVYQCLSVLKSKGYDGFVTVEFEGLEEPIKGCKYSLSSLKKMAQAIEKG